MPEWYSHICLSSKRIFSVFACSPNEYSAHKAWVPSPQPRLKPSLLPHPLPIPLSLGLLYSSCVHRCSFHWRGVDDIHILVPLSRHTRTDGLVTAKPMSYLSFESLQGAAQACTFAHVGMWPCNHGVQGLAFAFSPQMASIPYFSLLVGKKNISTQAHKRAFILGRPLNFGTGSLQLEAL